MVMECVAGRALSAQGKVGLPAAEGARLEATPQHSLYQNQIDLTLNTLAKYGHQHPGPWTFGNCRGK